jgi:hypothetical protein
MILKLSLFLALAALANGLFVPTSMQKQSEENVELKNPLSFLKKPTFDESVPSRYEENLQQKPLELIHPEIQKQPIQIQRPFINPEFKNPLYQQNPQYQSAQYPLQQKPLPVSPFPFYPQRQSQLPIPTGQYYPPSRSPFEEMKFPQQYPVDFSQTGEESPEELSEESLLNKPEYHAWVIYFPYRKSTSQDKSSDVESLYI